jgi:hypothetical protein
LAELLDRCEATTDLTPSRWNERTGLRAYSFEEPVAGIEAKLDQVNAAWREHLETVLERLKREGRPPRCQPSGYGS